MTNNSHGGRTTTTTNGLASIAPGGSTVLLLTPQQAAQALAISPRKLWSLTASGDIPCVRLGKCVRYPVDQLQQWIAGQTKGGTANGKS